MKRWFRPIAYSTILILLAVAIFGRPTTTSPGIVAPSSRLAHRVNALAVSPSTMHGTSLRARSEVALDGTLFGAATEATLEESLPVAASTAPAPPMDLKILGWMQSGTKPTVFVAYGNENYSLEPTQTVNDIYRFDQIGGGQAVFTYLPSGETRQYAVSDPALSE